MNDEITYKNTIDIMNAVRLYIRLIVWFGIIDTKQENITNIPPIQIRKIKNANHEDIDTLTTIDRNNAIIRIINPNVNGLIVIKIVVASDAIIKIKI